MLHSLLRSPHLFFVGYIGFVLVAIVLIGGAAADDKIQPHADGQYTPLHPFTHDRIGTEKTPAIIKLLPPADAEQKALEEKLDRIAKQQLDESTLKVGIGSVVVGALQLFAIAVQSFFLWLALKESKQATTTARQSLVTNRQAFVFAAGLFSEWEPGAPGSYNWRFRPVWRNTGETPTKDLVIVTHGELRITKLPANFDFNYPATAKGSGLLGPHSDANGGVFPLAPGIGITPQDILDIQAGKKYLFLWGWARYRDVFPGTPEHFTHFAWNISATGNPSAFIPGIQPPHAGSLQFGNQHLPEGNFTQDIVA